MGQITLSIPISGQPNSTEDPKVASDFTTIQNVINGGLDTNNLAGAAGIVAGQLALGAARWSYATDSLATHTLVDGQLYSSGFNGAVTVTLPTAIAGRVCAVAASGLVSGSQPVTIQRAGGDLIYGVGLSSSGVTSVLAGTAGQVIEFYASAAGQWLISRGQQDTGWVLLTGGTANWTVTFALRKIGDRVWCKGNGTNNTGGASAYSAALPAGFASYFGGTLNFAVSTGTIVGIGGGAFSTGSVSNGVVVYADEVSYSTT